MKLRDRKAALVKMIGHFHNAMAAAAAGTHGPNTQDYYDCELQMAHEEALGLGFDIEDDEDLADVIEENERTEICAWVLGKTLAALTDRYAG